jgi:hypothetical protein
MRYPAKIQQKKENRLSEVNHSTLRSDPSQFTGIQPIKMAEAKENLSALHIFEESRPRL